MSDFVENLKYSSNKITQILCEELENKGIKNYKPSLELVQGFGPYSPKEISNMQKEQRNILNARIAILERLSKEFETNEAFKGENGDKNKKMVMLYIQKFTTKTRDIYYIQNKFKKLYNIDLSNIAKEYIEPGVEKEFELKPETVKQIEEEDFSSHYDKENIEMMKKALMPSMKTRLKNSFLRIRGMFFKRKSQLLLPEGTDLRGKIRPEKKMRLYGENDDIENEEKEQPWWVLSSDEKETIEKANIYFAEKHKSINGNGKEQNVVENNYEEH